MSEKKSYPSESLKTIDLLGVKINPVPVETVIDFIIQTIHHQDRAIVSYVNVHAMNLADEIPWFRQFLNEAELTYCDGFGVKYGAWILGFNIPQRYTPPDWFSNLASTCAQKGVSLFFLGGRPEVAEKAATHLQNQFPDLRLVGTHHGFFNHSPQSRETSSIIEMINQVKPDILVVGLGMPLQERWLMENWGRIDSRVALPVGAMFDYLIDEVPRAPRWLTDRGYEWLGRLIVEPRRLWRRYLIGNPRFFFRVFRSRIQRA